MRWGQDHKGLCTFNRFSSNQEKAISATGTSRQQQQQQQQQQQRSCWSGIFLLLKRSLKHLLWLDNHQWQIHRFCSTLSKPVPEVNNITIFTASTKCLFTKSALNFDLQANVAEFNNLDLSISSVHENEIITWTNYFMLSNCRTLVFGVKEKYFEDRWFQSYPNQNILSFFTFLSSAMIQEPLCGASTCVVAKKILRSDESLFTLHSGSQVSTMTLQLQN